MKPMLAIPVLLLALASCKTAEESLKEAGNKPLTSVELRSLLSGNTLLGTNDRGFDYVTYYRPDGTSHLKSKKFDEQGKWRIDPANGYCTQWPFMNDGKEQCRSIYKVGDRYQMIRPDGSDSSTFTIAKGNPNKL